MKFKVYDDGYPASADSAFDSLEAARSWVRITWGTLVEISPMWDGSPLKYGPPGGMKNHTVEIRLFDDGKKSQNIYMIYKAAKELWEAEQAEDEDWAGQAEANLINALRAAGYDKFFQG